VRALDSIVPDWQARYQDIAGSEPVASRMTVGGGLRLRVSASNGWIIFWTTRPVGELLARLASAGVPVAWVPVRISFWTGRDV
jgi:hypothetical protein